MKRRQFLTISICSIGGVLAFETPGITAARSGQPKTARIPLKFFSEDEALDVAAAAARIFPTDETGPGAKEAGVVIYIDRQLAGPFGDNSHRYAQPPFEENAPPEMGYQGKATPREIYKAGVKTIAGLHNLTEEEQDRKLRGIENSPFFALLRANTIEGMFCDPMHGGNVDMAGWQMVGFPGPRMSYFNEIDQYNGRAFRPKPISLRQASGRVVRPSEEEA